MATKGTATGSDEVITTKCCTCAEKNVTREAEKYCMECQAYYCISCTDMHRIFPMMKGHNLLDKTEFSTTSLQASLPCFLTERCSIHKAKVLEMYCKNHDVVLCTTCVALDHRMCEDIHSIPDEVDKLYEPSSSDVSIQQLTAEKENEASIKTDKQHLLDCLKEHKKEAADSITDCRQEMEAELKRLEAEAIKKLDEEYGRIEKGLLNDIKELDENTNDLEKSAQKLKRSGRNKAQDFVNVKIAENFFSHALKSRSHLERPTNVEMGFQADLKIQNLLKESKTLGEVSTKKPAVKPKTTAYIVKTSKDINIKLTEDRNVCCISGSCFTRDGVLLIVDNNNNKLKRLDASTEFITDHVDLEASPNAICQTSKQVAAVSLKNQTIQFVLLGDKMITTRKLKMGHYCSGLAFSEGQLFISDERNNIYITDLNGTTLIKITTSMWSTSNLIVTNHISIYSGDVLMADYSGHSLISQDIHSDGRLAIAEPDFRRPSGVCTDGRGTIFACDFNSSIIVQKESIFERVCVIAKTMRSPVSVCFDPNQNKLVVTLYKHNFLTVYELQ